MGQSIFINFDSESLTGSRCRAADDLRSRKFSPMVAGDSLVFDLFLTGVDGLLNIQDYSVVRMGVGNLNARPESGTYSVGAVSLDYNNSAADLETAIETATGNGCAVVQLSPFVFKVTFDAVGAQTIPSIDESDLTPRSTVDRQTLQTGDATTREIWLWRLYANPIAFTDVFVDVAGNGAQGTLALSTAGIYDLLGDNSSVKTFFEIELTDSAGDIVTVMQTEIVLTGEVIGNGFAGYIPSATGLSGDIQSFLASADYAVARNRLLDTDSVVWCNQGDNLQAKYDEAFALLPNGNVQSITNRASLIVMGGTYSSIFASSQSAEYFVDIIGIGSVKTDSIEFVGDLYGDIRNIKFTTFSCDRILGLLDNVESLNQAGFNCNEVTSTGKIENSKFVTFEISGDNSGTIKNVYVHQQILGITGDNLGTIQSINCADFVVYGTNEGVIRNIDCRADFTVFTNNKLITSVNCYQFYMESNYGTIESLIGRQDFSCLNNYGTIRDCTGNGFLGFCINLGIVDSCENKFDTAYGNNHSFGSVFGSLNGGTIRDCKSYSNPLAAFGPQSVSGLTEGCSGGTFSFAAKSIFIDWSSAAIQGTYRDCHGGDNSFFGRNISTDTAKVIQATYINCTSGNNSFGFVNAVGVNGIWILHNSIPIPEETMNLITDEDVSRAERFEAVDAWKASCCSPSDPEDAEAAQAIYDAHKMEANTFISATVFLPSGNGVINCREPETLEHCQIRF
jgi:hypothetical protein